MNIRLKYFKIYNKKTFLTINHFAFTTCVISRVFNLFGAVLSFSRFYYFKLLIFHLRSVKKGFGLKISKHFSQGCYAKMIIKNEKLNYIHYNIP